MPGLEHHSAIWRAMSPEKFLDSCMLFARAKRLIAITALAIPEQMPKMRLGDAHGELVHLQWKSVMDKLSERIAKIFNASLPRMEKARQLAGVIQALGKFHWVGLYNVTRTHVSAIAWSGTEAPVFPSFLVSQGINGAAVMSKRPVIVQDVSADRRYITTFSTTKAEAVYPVFSSDGSRVLGTIDVESDRINAFRPEDETFLEHCARLLRPLWE
jgi:putative methionine-R-sulfoxide reductase with GAF domain